jgi:hypothetical protein
MEGIICNLNQGILLHFLGRTEKTIERLQSGQPVSGPEIRTEGIPKTKQQYQWVDRDVWWKKLQYFISWITTRVYVMFSDADITCCRIHGLLLIECMGSYVKPAQQINIHWIPLESWCNHPYPSVFCRFPLQLLWMTYRTLFYPLVSPEEYDSILFDQHME